MTELNEVLRRLPIGETFDITISPNTPHEDFPNIIGQLRRHRHGFVFIDFDDSHFMVSVEKPAPKKSVARRKGSVRK